MRSVRLVSLLTLAAAGLGAREARACSPYLSGPELLVPTSSQRTGVVPRNAVLRFITRRAEDTQSLGALHLVPTGSPDAGSISLRAEPAGELPKGSARTLLRPLESLAPNTAYTVLE